LHHLVGRKERQLWGGIIKQEQAAAEKNLGQMRETAFPAKQEEDETGDGNIAEKTHQKR